MQLSQLRTAVTTRLGTNANDGLFPATVLNDLVNAANHFLETVTDWPWLEVVTTFATVNGQDKYSPPAGWMRTLRLQVGDYAPLQRVDIAELISMTGSGRPTHYAIVGDQIQVRPVPASVLTITHIYIKQEPDLAVDTDTPLAPASYHAAIVEYATYLAWRRAANTGEANGALSIYEEWKKQMMQRHSRQSPSEGGGLLPNPDVPATPQGRGGRTGASSGGN